MLLLPEDDNAILIGVDEAGRGALAFDVTASAVVLPSYKKIMEMNLEEDELNLLEKIKDSKKMTKKQREQCFHFIKKIALYYEISSASPQEIDDINILKATMMAMRRAVESVVKQIHRDEEKEEREDTVTKQIRLQIDGDHFYPYFDEHTQKVIPYDRIPNGDAIHMNIAAASILSKVYRDNVVDRMCDENPEFEEQYGFRSNKAYGTKKHMDGLKNHGATPFHRNSFAPVRNVSNNI